MRKNKVRKIMRGTPLHLSKSGRLKAFTYLMINLPFLCNYRCKKCFNLKNNNFQAQNKPLTISKIFNLIDQAKRMGGKVVVMAGEGEPSLNKNIKKIIQKVNSLGMYTVIYSNGSTLTKELINYYATHNTTLVISLDSLSEKLYLKMTNNANKEILKKVLKNIELARKIYRKFIEKKHNYKIVRLAVNTTINSLNKNEVENIKSFCGDDIYFICNPLARLGNAVKNWKKLMLNRNEDKEIQKIIKSMSETTGPLTLGKNGLCGYSINGIAVNPAGDYMTCAYTNLTTGLVGSVFNKPLAQAYQYKNQQEKKFYKKYGKYPCLVRSPKFSQYIKTLK